VAASASLDCSQGKGVGIEPLSIARWVFVPGGLPGGPLFLFARLGCCSAIASPLPLLLPSPFGVPTSPTSLELGFLGVGGASAVLVDGAVLAVASDGS
jgi:hypothetical protein